MIRRQVGNQTPGTQKGERNNKDQILCDHD